ncbi:unnamed protein product [Parnassius mnemosyne]|uniref:Centriolar coiled-coil protein of 110 kDa n=1 Tax=Parnassius mnemosyne TaxID=213953 RepID=A0AAV1KE81_9NEOP
MNDPWDVKSVRQSSQYTSCMKINGVPLLPPVLSKECRKEMQYYKLLAKEVEKRISLLKSYVSGSDSDTSTDKTEAPELPESEQNNELPVELNSICTEKIVMSETDTDKSINRSTNSLKYSCLSSNNSDKVILNLTPLTDTSIIKSSKLMVDLSISFTGTDDKTLHENKTKSEIATDLPEHDYEEPEKCLKEGLEPKFDLQAKNVDDEVNKYETNFKINNSNIATDSFINYVSNDGPSSLSSKSFTGSLHDIRKESSKETQSKPLIRQRSYTVLTPSPMLLAHLQIQSLSTGVEMTSISMSDSLSNLSSPNKKRRSWDLETAKVKWSNMALELKKKNIAGNVTAAKNGGNKIMGAKKHVTSRSEMSKTLPIPRSRSLVNEKHRHVNATSKILTKSENIQKIRTNCNPSENINDNKVIIHSPASKDIPKTELASDKSQLISECDDPAKRVRELYERIQKQQLIQMATLVEKQKKEQILLQQVFEEQNNLLYTQLKSICPKSPGEIKEAWTDKGQEAAERGPVSLSQLINHKPLEQNVYDSPASTLTDTNSYINRCDNVLKKSRDITGSIKKQQMKNDTENCAQTTATNCKDEVIKVLKTHSPKNRNTNASRKLTYETSASSDREYDLLLTDRTNDTMADLNVTFPSDHSDDYRPVSHSDNVVSHLCGKEMSADRESSGTMKEVPCMSTDSAIKSVEDTIKNSILDVRARLVRKNLYHAPTAEERAAATKIVAYAKGYLVRRLMKTERVQSTVQTIRDALLCALQLHQDREGIRGADVDLHRRLIQQITAACYSLHDTFIGSSAAERCGLIAADRARKRSLALRPSPRHYKPTDIMSQSHSGSFPSRPKRHSPTSAMTQSNYESFSGEKAGLRSRYMGSPRRRPWR